MSAMEMNVVRINKQTNKLQTTRTPRDISGVGNKNHFVYKISTVITYSR